MGSRDGKRRRSWRRRVGGEKLVSLLGCACDGGIRAVADSGAKSGNLGLLKIVKRRSVEKLKRNSAKSTSMVDELVSECLVRRPRCRGAWQTRRSARKKNKLVHFSVLSFLLKCVLEVYFIRK